MQTNAIDLDVFTIQKEALCHIKVCRSYTDSRGITIQHLTILYQFGCHLIEIRGGKRPQMGVTDAHLLTNESARSCRLTSFRCLCNKLIVSIPYLLTHYEATI